MYGCASARGISGPGRGPVAEQCEGAVCVAPEGRQGQRGPAQLILLVHLTRPLQQHLQSLGMPMVGLQTDIDTHTQMYIQKELIHIHPYTNTHINTDTTDMHIIVLTHKYTQSHTNTQRKNMRVDTDIRMDQK